MKWFFEGTGKFLHSEVADRLRVLPISAPSGEARREGEGDFVGASLLANRASRLTAWLFVLPNGPLSLKGGGRPCMGEESSTPASPAGV